jgi:hypothetical protein
LNALAPLNMPRMSVTVVVRCRPAW